MAPELEVAIVKATSHDDDPPNQKYIHEILNLTSYSRGYVHACVSFVSKRLLNEGDPLFQEEILYATRKGTRLLNMSDFKDEAHSSSWIIRLLLGLSRCTWIKDLNWSCLKGKEVMVAVSVGVVVRGSAHGGEIERLLRRQGSPQPRAYEYSDQYNGDYNRGESGNGMARRTRSYGDMSEVEMREGREEKKTATPLREMKPERIFGKMGHLQRLLDRFLSCRPTGLAKNNRMILIALYPVVKESFKLYSDICEVLAVLLDKFFDMEYPDCVKAFDAYTSAAKQIDELTAFYNWCKDTGCGEIV
ncbi:clathrin assembly family protein [Salix suchowensis]|nr:clathrin assembly family protein [Salix suchowensis]